MATTDTANKMEEWISAEEKDLVKSFRERMGKDFPVEELARPEDDQTAFCLRWLRARELNLDKAEALLRAAIQWRKDNEVDLALTRELDPFLTESYQWKTVAADLGGRPVIIYPFYEWDFRKMISANKTEGFDYLVQKFFESISKDVREYGEKRKPGEAPVTQFTIVVDCNGFAYFQMMNFTAMRKWFQMAATYEAYYPEVLYRANFINCPSYFQLFINMLKAFLCPRTLAKFKCYPSVEEWQKDIGEMMDPALIPVQYGGTSPINPLERSSTQG